MSTLTEPVPRAACWRRRAIARSTATPSRFDRLEQLSERVHRLAETGRAEVGCRVGRRARGAAGSGAAAARARSAIVADGKRAEESYKRRRHARRGAARTGRSQLALLRRSRACRDTPR